MRGWLVLGHRHELGAALGGLPLLARELVAEGLDLPLELVFAIDFGFDQTFELSDLFVELKRPLK
jgi:hypothetical protein